jgi:DNA-binding IclR family transcriptional regulator
MSSFGKMLAILDLFDVDGPVLTAEEIISRMGYSRPQSYRYIRELGDAGFLMRFKGGYTLGPRCIQLDHIIRQSDPLLNASVPVIREASIQNGCDILLTRMYQNRIIAVYHERGPDPMTVSFGRGRLMPLFRGAGSKVILAALSSARQKQLYQEHPEEAAKSSIGSSWDEVKENLRVIRRAGYAISVGELDPANVGIAVPLMLEGMTTPSSIVLVLSAARYRTTNIDAVVQVILSVREDVLAALTRSNGEHPRELNENIPLPLNAVTCGCGSQD